MKPPRGKYGNNAPPAMPRPLRLIQGGVWLDDAACKGADLTLFYDGEHETPDVRAVRVMRAKEICHVCPVRKQCFDTAMSNDEAYGIWGGYTAPERYQLKRIMDAS